MAEIATRATLTRPRAEVASAFALTCTVALAGSLLAAYAARVETWFVMTDELLYVKLATSVGTTLSPLPVVHGEHVAVLNQLYPLLLAPLFGVLDVPAAFRAAHVLNAFVMASAAVPAYLLARDVVPRLWAHAVSVLSVAVPWTVLSGVLMTEAAAYPAFLWAVVALQRSLPAPSPRADVVALAGMGLAVLARTQFVVLALVFPIAVLVYERPALRNAVRRHRVLAATYAVAVLVAVIAAAAGVLGRALGSYSAATEGELLPAGVWRAALVHLDVVGVGLGIVPLLLGVAWLLQSVVRPASGGARAFAALAFPVCAALALETASYDLRFGGGDMVRDRYLFYVAPLLLVAAAAALRERPRALVLLGVAAVFAWSVLDHDFERHAGLSFDGPASVVNDALHDQAGSLGAGSFVALAALLLGAVLVLALRIVPEGLLAGGLAAAVLAYSVTVTTAAVGRVLGSEPPTPRHLGSGGVAPNWIDGVLPAGAKAAAVPHPVSPSWDLSALLWWDVEFWNSTVGEVLVRTDGHFSYTVPPSRLLRLDFATGTIPGTADRPEFVVAAAGDPRFRLAGDRHAANQGLEVIRVERPYRLEWATRGLAVDGWTLPGRPATLRVYAAPGMPSAVADVRVQLAAPPAQARYTISAAGVRRADGLGPGETRTEELRLCVPADGYADVRIVAGRSASIAAAPLVPRPTGTRAVGVAVGPIQVERLGQPC